MLVATHLIGFGAGSGAFVPWRDLANVFAWYRSDLGVTQSGTVSQWNDQSGNARHLTQGTAGNQPTYSASGGPNSYPAIQFDSGSDFLLISSLSLAQPFHCFTVLKQNTWTDGDNILNFQAGTALIAQSGVSPQIKHFGGSIGNPVSLTLGSWGLVQSFFNDASSYQALNDGANVTGDIDGGGLNRIMMGESTGNCADVEIVEFGLVSAEVTGASLTNLETYFGSRYGLF